MTGVEDLRHFSFPNLTQELARIDRPWRRLWTLCAGVGAAAGVAGVVLIYELVRSGTGAPGSWLAPSLLVACLAPAALSIGALRSHPSPPAEAWVSGKRVTLGGPGRSPVSFLWSERRRPLVLSDLRATGPTWRQDGSARSVDFILSGTKGALRTPLPKDAVDVLIRAAESNGYRVQGVKGEITRQGIVGLVRIDPPRRRR